jgi:putative flippase GtrA
MPSSSAGSRLVTHWRAAPRPLRFLLVGGINTVFGYTAYAALLFAGLDYVLAAFFGTLAGVAFNYFTTGGLVFDHLSRSALARFVTTYIIVYLVNIGCVAMLGRIGVNAYLAGLILVLPMAMIAYVLMSRFVFGGRRVAD